MEQSEKTRRHFLRQAALTTVGIGFLKIDLKASSAGTANTALAEPLFPEGQFTLPPLPYDTSALEPYIDTMTMQIHHDKHHAAYVNKLNDALEKAPELKGKTLEELIMNLAAVPDAVRTAIRNQGGGHWNHSFFWKILSPKGPQSQPSDTLTAQINTQYKSIDAMKQELIKSATSVFGSGWTWLIKTKDNSLKIVNTPNQDNPLMDITPEADKGKPIVGIDVWEHAYYLKHKNVRADYLNDIMNVIDWEQAAKLYDGKM